MQKNTVTVCPSHPWFTDSLYRAKCESRKAERRWRETGLTVHKEIHKEAMRCYSRMFDSAKSSYFNAKIADAEPNSRAMSRIMNEILANNQDSKLPSLP